jgi:hypothetical protein
VGEKPDNGQHDSGETPGNPQKHDGLPDEHVAERAKKIVDGREDDGKIAEGDTDKATRAADAILKDSEERTFDEATVDPDEDNVIRRSSEETA